MTQTLADQRCPVVKTAINENNWLWRQIIPGLVGDSQNITDVRTCHSVAQLCPDQSLLRVDNVIRLLSALQSEDGPA